VGVFKPGEDINGMYWQMDHETKEAVRRAVENADPKYLDMLTSNPEFIRRIASKLAGINSAANGSAGNGFLASTPLGERMREQIDGEEDVTLPNEKLQRTPGAAEDGADPYWHSSRPALNQPQSPAQNGGRWAAGPRPVIPVNQRPAYVPGLGQEPEKLSLGRMLIYASAAGSLLMLALKFLGDNNVPVVSEGKSRSLRNPDGDSGPGEAEVEVFATATKPIFPYDKSLSIGKNADHLYDEEGGK